MSAGPFPPDWSLDDDVAFLEWLAALSRGEPGRSVAPHAGGVFEFSCRCCGELRTTAAPWQGAPECCGAPMAARLRRLPRRDVWP
jgi:hypothetical protein